MIKTRSPYSGCGMGAGPGQYMVGEAVAGRAICQDDRDRSPAMSVGSPLAGRKAKNA